MLMCFCGGYILTSYPLLKTFNMKIVHSVVILLLLLLIVICAVITLPDYDWVRYMIAFVALIEMLYLMYITFDNDDNDFGGMLVS